MTEYPIVILPLSDEDGGGFMAAFPDLPGCVSDGETREEAVMNAEDAFQAWMEVQVERGAEIPKPGSSASQVRDQFRSLVGALRATIDYADSADRKIEALENALDQAVNDLGSGWVGSRLTLAAINDSKRISACH